MAISVKLPKETFEAPLTVGDHVHLVLRAYLTGVGPVWSVHNDKTGEWMEEPDYAGDIDSAKVKAEEAAKAIARHLLNRAGTKEKLPPIVWQSR
jgi:hypothetical protein